jgi:lysophospholipase L1-like esterase
MKKIFIKLLSFSLVSIPFFMFTGCNNKTDSAENSGVNAVKFDNKETSNTSIAAKVDCNLQVTYLQSNWDSKNSALYKFDFGNGKAANGFIKVDNKTSYNKERGYGFLDASKVISVERTDDNELTSDYLAFKDTSFEVDVPSPGIYEVRFIAGDKDANMDFNVSAQDNLPVSFNGINPPAGVFIDTNFMINVSDKRLSIKMTDRNGRFSGGINAMEIKAVPKTDRQVVYIAGDSTVSNYCMSTYAPQAGWGQLLNKYLSNKYIVRNHAVGGMSAKSFTNNKNFQSIMEQIKPNDILLIQFGINDSNSKDPARYADAQTEFKALLKTQVNEAIKLKAIPVLVTAQGRRGFDEAGNYTGSGDRLRYVEAIRELSKEMNVPLVDLRAKSSEVIAASGIEGSKELFLWVEPNKYPYNYAKGSQDDLHIQEKGADIFAKLVAEELLNLKIIK